MRFFRGAAALVLVFLLGSLSPRSGVHASTPVVGKYYIALGDSFSAGYLTPSLPIDTQCLAPDAPGFPCLFYRYLRQQNPALHFVNFSQPGADSCQLVQGHRCYDSTSRATHLDAAIALVKAYPGEVSPITITIGGNDVLALVPAALANPTSTVARLPAVFRMYRANLDVILSRLRTAAPSARIIVTTQPNSLGGIPASFLPKGLSAIAGTAVDNLNAVMKQEAGKYGAIIADSAAAFARNPGGAYLLTYLPQVLVSGDPSQANIHPTANGYRVYAIEVIKDSGYLLPLSVSAHVSKHAPLHGKSDRVKGRTSSDAAISVHVVLPGGRVRNITGRTSAAGAFVVKFKVGTRTGNAHLRACATDMFGRRACGTRLLFVVR